MTPPTPIRVQAATIGLLSRQDGVSLDEFSAYWAEKHGPLVVSFELVKANIRRYEQMHRDQQTSDEISTNMGIPIAPYDGVMLQGAESYNNILAAWSDPEDYKKVREDHVKFAHPDVPSFLGQLYTLLEVPGSPEKGMKKDRIRAVSLFTRGPGLSIKDFQKYWLETHAKFQVGEGVPIVTENITRYEQFHVDRLATEELSKAQGLTPLPYDGIAIQEAESFEKLFEVWSDPDYACAIEDSKKFIDQESVIVLPAKYGIFI